MADKRIGRQLLLIQLIPVLGGLVEYWRFRDTDSRIGTVLLAGSFTGPILFGGGYAAATLLSGSTIAVILGAVITGVIATLLLLYVFQENPYRDLLWAAYLSIFGALYLYYGPYTENPRLRRAVKQYLRYATGLLGLLVLFSLGMLYLA